MSDFGNLVKGFVDDLEKRESISTQQARKEKEITYRCEASGIDMAITRVLNGKDTRTLGIILSQTDNDGNPLVVMKEKNKAYEVSEKSLSSFFDSKDLDTAPISTGCTAIPKIRKGKAFISTLWAFIHSPNAVKLAKMGVLDTECLLDIFENERYSSSAVWYVPTYGSYDNVFIGINRMKDENFANVHQKMIKFAVAHMMKNFDLSYSSALKYVYTSGSETRNRYYYGGNDRNETDNGRKYVTNKSFKAFIVLANRYDEPFALKCMEEYYDDVNLLGLDYEKLYQLFGIPMNDRNFNKSSYSGMSISPYSNIRPSDLVTGKSQKIEDNCVNFEKNRLWEYILNSTCVGMGTRLGDYVGHWKDYIMMALITDKKIREKYPEHLQVAHDIFSEKYDFVKDRVEQEALMKATEIPSKICDVNIKNFQFRILRTAQAFSDEASQNSNCVASYITRCAAGNTIVGSFRPKGEDNTLLTVEVSPQTYKFIQIKGKFNREPTVKEMEELNKIQTKVLRRYEKYTKFGIESLDKKDVEDFLAELGDELEEKKDDTDLKV